MHIRADERGDLLSGVSKFWAMRPWVNMVVASRVKFLMIFSAFMDKNSCPHVSCVSVKTAAVAVDEGRQDEVVLKMLVVAIGIKRRKRGSVGASKDSSAMVGMKRGLLQWKEMEALESTEDEDDKGSEGDVSSDNSEDEEVVRRPKRKSSIASTRKPAKKQKKCNFCVISIFCIVMFKLLFIRRFAEQRW